MHVVCIVVSVNYTDFLRRSLPLLVAACDVVVVVSQEGDSSVALCKEHNVACYSYDGWQHNGATFNKSGALEQMQKMVHEKYPDSWVLIADADCEVPIELRESINAMVTDKDVLYGIRRVDFQTPEEYAAAHARYYAFPFSGYFQLYYKKTAFYPVWSRNASMCDCFFREHFNKWQLLPGTVYHLGTDNVNWNGRKSQEWIAHE